MKRCHLCGAQKVWLLLDFGKQPITNRFLSDPRANEDLYPLVLNQCEVCGLVQISDPVPAEELKPKHEWITYSEPEDHLDQVATILAALPGIGKDSSICGVSFKDDSLLERMRELGFRHVWRLEPERDLGIEGRGVGVETIQGKLNLAAASRLARVHGRAGLVILRHILEHAHNIKDFMEALHTLVSPGGYVNIEVPDCRQALDLCDYSTVWEEHILYFTPDTFRQCFAQGGLRMARFESFPYELENSLVGIGQAQYAAAPYIPSASTVRKERVRAQEFSRRLPEIQGRVRSFLEDHRRKGGKVAMLGAGHLAAFFINAFGLKDYIEFVGDDDSRKRGLYMPGSRLPIYGSKALMDKAISLCLLGVNPVSEEKVIRNNKCFLDKGGKFLSIFPASDYALHKASSFPQGNY